MKEIKIRKATKEDADSIFNLEKEWQNEGISWGIHIHSKKEVLKDLRQGICYIDQGVARPC